MMNVQTMEGKPSSLVDLVIQISIVGLKVKTVNCCLHILTSKAKFIEFHYFPSKWLSIIKVAQVFGLGFCCAFFFIHFPLLFSVLPLFNASIFFTFSCTKNYFCCKSTDIMLSCSRYQKDFLNIQRIGNVLIAKPSMCFIL